MKSLFPDPDFDELYGFSLVHKAVLGLADDCSVETAISLNPAQIDQPDLGEMTPLHWAVTRGDIKATQQLLSYMPDCNKSDYWGYTPLGHAVRKNADCVELLLQANANVHHRINRHRNTVLHWAAVPQNDQYDQSTRIVELLVRAGVNVNAFNIHNETALHLTLDPVMARFLIKNGADVGGYEIAGHNALSAATLRNNHALIRLFLQERQDHTQSMKNYGSFLHLISEFADTVTLRLLAQGGLTRRSINVTNKAGLTPIELARQRRHVNREWWTAFFEFLHSVEDSPTPADPSSFNIFQAASRSNSDTRVDDDGESKGTDEEFKDAVEFQSAADHP